jgi:hypothetical protein
VERTGRELQVRLEARVIGPPFTTTLERMNRRATRLTLTLAVLSWVLLIGGRYIAATPGWEAFRLLGFSLGGMLSIVTLILCIYYLSYGHVKTAGLTIATASAAIYGTAFIAVYAALFLFTNQPFAARLVGYAF